MIKVDRLPICSEFSRIFSKTVHRLLNSLRQRFYKYTRNIVSDEPYKNRDNTIRLNNFSNKKQ